MKNKNYYRNPAPMWAEPFNDAALRHQPVRITHRIYRDGILISKRTYGPRGERRPAKKATLHAKIAFSFHNPEIGVNSIFPFPYLYFSLCFC